MPDQSGGTVSNGGQLATIAVTLPPEDLARVVDALCAARGYTGTPDDEAARQEFARCAVADFIRNAVMDHERKQAMAAAMANVTVAPITID